MNFDLTVCQLSSGVLRQLNNLIVFFIFHLCQHDSSINMPNRYKPSTTKHCGMLLNYEILTEIHVKSIKLFSILRLVIFMLFMYV